MFRELFVREGFEFDYMYDWILKKQALKQRLAASTRNTQRVEEEKKAEDAKKNVREVNAGSLPPMAPTNHHHDSSH